MTKLLNIIHDFIRQEVRVFGFSKMLWLMSRTLGAIYARRTAVGHPATKEKKN